MSEQRESTISQTQQPAIIDIENAILQMDTYDLQINSWQHDIKQKESVYDEYVNKHELKVTELETEILDLQCTISRLLGDFEGISNIERTNSMEAKKSRLLEYRQAMKQEITMPIDEFAAMEVTRENTVSDSSSDREAIKEALSLAFYRNLGIEVHPNTEDSRHRMKLISYHKPNVCNFTFNESSDDFVNAQKIWDCISP